MTANEVNLATGGRLCAGLDWRQWDAVLDCGRRKRLSGQRWLETYTESGEVFAVFLSGQVGLLAVSPDLENRRQLHLTQAPAIVELSDEPDPDLCHWVAEPAEVYFYSQSALMSAFSTAPAFGCNFIDVLCGQQARITEALSEPMPLGIRRLARSLLARAAASGDGKSIRRVSVTQAELAFESGLSRQWVNHLLQGLEKKGVTQVGRGYVVLTSPTTLQGFL